MNDRERNGREPRVVGLALDLLDFCDRVEGTLVRRGKVALNGQLQDAGASVLANVGEAYDEPNLGDKRRFFHYALRSAGECQRLLRGGGAVRALSPADLKEGLRRTLDVKMDLLRLIRWCTREMGGS